MDSFPKSNERAVTGKYFLPNGIPLSDESLSEVYYKDASGSTDMPQANPAYGLDGG